MNATLWTAIATWKLIKLLLVLFFSEIQSSIFDLSSMFYVFFPSPHQQIHLRSLWWKTSQPFFFVVWRCSSFFLFFSLVFTLPLACKRFNWISCNTLFECLFFARSLVLSFSFDFSISFPFWFLHLLPLSAFCLSTIRVQPLS